MNLLLSVIESRMLGKDRFPLSADLQEQRNISEPVASKVHSLHQNPVDAPTATLMPHDGSISRSAWSATLEVVATDDHLTVT